VLAGCPFYMKQGWGFFIAVKQGRCLCLKVQQKVVIHLTCFLAVGKRAYDLAGCGRICQHSFDDCNRLLVHLTEKVARFHVAVGSLLQLLQFGKNTCGQSYRHFSVQGTYNQYRAAAHVQLKMIISELALCLTLLYQDVHVRLEDSNRADACF
jgi:hypothetical protein